MRSALLLATSISQALGQSIVGLNLPAKNDITKPAFRSKQLHYPSKEEFYKKVADETCSSLIKPRPTLCTDMLAPSEDGTSFCYSISARKFDIYTQYPTDHSYGTDLATLMYVSEGNLTNVNQHLQDGVDYVSLVFRHDSVCFPVYFQLQDLRVGSMVGPGAFTIDQRNTITTFKGWKGTLAFLNSTAPVSRYEGKLDLELSDAQWLSLNRTIYNSYPHHFPVPSHKICRPSAMAVASLCQRAFVRATYKKGNAIIEDKIVYIQNLLLLNQGNPNEHFSTFMGCVYS
ncbi:hypothetical protein DSO57_1027561 [Entomophthora muscae]|uniref:Uncharacterized protein n=1 Tax=Entomophthora muscae TaxID=34485 RepID=A0ACC2T1V3_9FUNG|nr:hypothetical protein DSO57_1027561 [Entomophthora muscae]